ncbi:hypothetical protein ACRALDRAFT_1077788 [Sodiomyces alcalophilus JCM 7366]|uniref:uncharacterized protein n=1 Tax=Sodiomyces alcalophilus JCM 7366 TaxID=591952 RepID=UPI0039B5C94D
MANTNKPTDPLDQIQFMLNDVIVQIGKALRATHQQAGRRNVAQVQALVQNRVPDTIENFHWALDDLESEIVNAKGALQRDLDRLQAKRTSPRNEPPASEVGPKSSATADSNPPQPPAPGLQLKQEGQDASGASQTAPAAPMAPFPDMSAGAVAASARVTDASIKPESAPSAPQAVMGPVGDAGASSNEAKPPLAAPEAPMDDMLRVPRAANRAPGAEFNFTDMTFDLAPASNETQNPPASQNSNMDTSRFGSADDMLSLDQFLPPNTANQSGTGANNAANNSANNATVPATTPTNQKPEEQTRNTATAATGGMGEGGGGKSNLDNTAMDLGLDVGGGADSSNFDDMFFGNSNVEEIQFDDAFFGIS